MAKVAAKLLTRPAPPPPPELPKIGTLDFYLFDIARNLSDVRSHAFQHSVSAFRQFAANEYRKEKNAKNESMFVNTLFQSISATIACGPN
jgi:hypothetical protein